MSVKSSSGSSFRSAPSIAPYGFTQKQVNGIRPAHEDQRLEENADAKDDSLCAPDLP